LADINGVAPSEDSRKYINSRWVAGCRQPTDVMRSREAWARSACDVSVPGVGLGHHPHNDRHKICGPLRGVVPSFVVLLFRQRSRRPADDPGVFKPVRLEDQPLRSLMLARTDVCEIWFENYTVCGERVVLVYYSAVGSDSTLLLDRI